MTTPKQPWEPMQVRHLGDVADLVLGGGNMDGKISQPPVSDDATGKKTEGGG
jgi:hypothetical protein